MVKKQLLILLIVFGCGNSSQAMIEQWLGMGICDFGVLKNPSQDDRDAYQKYRQSQAPIVLAMNAYNIANRVKSLASTIDVYSNALGYKGVEFNGSLVELEKYILKEYTYFLGYLREIAVDYSARGSIHVPQYDEFNKLMAKVLARVIHGHCDKRKQLEIDLKKEKEDSSKFARLFVEYHTKSNQFEGELKKLKEDYQEANADLTLANQAISQKDKMLIQCAYAISDLEDANKDLKVKSTHQEKVALEVAKEVIELEECNQMLKEERDRAFQEKAKLTNRLEEEIESIGTSVSQRHEHVLSLFESMRKEISPLRRELSPLRRQVATQEIELAEKDAEIARLKNALVTINICNDCKKTKKKISRLEALKKASKQN